jgi:hypothetical protein
VLEQVHEALALVLVDLVVEQVAENALRFVLARLTAVAMISSKPALMP